MRLWFRRKPLALVIPVDPWDRDNGWIIQYREIPSGWDKPRNDWMMCPGTLYGVYPTPEEARLVAGWWGFRV